MEVYSLITELIIEIIKILLFVLGMTLVVKKWRPPLKVSHQALIVLAVGALYGWFFYEDLEIGLLAGSFFWRGELITELKGLLKSIDKAKESEV
jgi:hypothetical protein